MGASRPGTQEAHPPRDPVDADIQEAPQARSEDRKRKNQEGVMRHRHGEGVVSASLDADIPDLTDPMRSRWCPTVALTDTDGMTDLQQGPLVEQ